MILVTGGTGLVGAHLLYQLCLNNTRVKAIYRNNGTLQLVKNVFGLFSEDYDTLFNKIDWVQADITDICSLEAAFENVTKVYHAAALVSFDPADYRLMRKINIEGTANIVNFCIKHKVAKLAYVSSIATVGKPNKAGIIDELCEWTIEKDSSGYAITKYGAEMEVWRASQEGIPVVIVNPGVIVGVGYWHKGTGKLFSKIHKGLHFYTNGVTGFVSATDVAKTLIALMNSTVTNERFILVSENLSFKKVFNNIALGFGKKPPSIKITPLLSSIAWRILRVASFFSKKSPVITKNSATSLHNRRYYSSEKIKNELGINFETITPVLLKICDAYKKVIT